MAVLHIQAEADYGLIRLATAGELDLSTVGALEAELRSAETQDPSAIVIDMRRLKFVDSTGLGALLEASARAHAGGWRLVLAVRRGPIMRLLEITALDRRFEIVHDPSEVLGSARHPRRTLLAPGGPAA